MTTRSAVRGVPVFRDEFQRPAGGVEVVEEEPVVHGDTFVGVNLLEMVGDRGREHVPEQPVVRGVDVHGGADGVECDGDLGTDVTAADDGDPGPLRDFAPQVTVVADAADAGDPAVVATLGVLQRAGGRTGRQQQRPVGDGVPTVGGDGVGGRVDCGDRHTGDQLGAGVPGGAQVDVFEAGRLVEPEGLGEVRSGHGALGIPGEDEDGGVRCAPVDGTGGLVSGHAAADDDVIVGCLQLTVCHGSEATRDPDVESAPVDRAGGQGRWTGPVDWVGTVTPRAVLTSSKPPVRWRHD
jgi:hypothetical protein